MKADRQARELGYVEAIIGKLKKEFVRKVVVVGDIAVVVVEVLVKVVDATVDVVPPPPPPPSAKPDVVVVATLLETVVAREIVPVQTAPVGQQATWFAKSSEQMAFFVQQIPASMAASVEQEL